MREKRTLYKFIRAVQAPSRIVPHLQRIIRNRRLKRESASPLEFYAKVVDDMSEKSPNGAVGTPSFEAWLEVGKLQFDFLISHGLKPEHRLLDIGCGNLRGGWRIIDYLSEGNYVGLEISPKILMAALDTLTKHNLQQKEPYLFLIDRCDYGFLPDTSFHYVHAHSVFSHMPLHLIRECLGAVKRLLKLGGHFDFTFLPTGGDAYSFCDEDFYYPAQDLLEAACAAGYQARVMEDWHYSQGKIRATKAES